MNDHIHFPFYAKFALLAVGTVALVFLLYIGQQIILPIIYAIIFSILLNPVVNLLVAKKIDRVLAISIAVFSTILITALLFYFVSIQITIFSETYPQLKEKLNEVSAQAIHWVSIHFNIKTIKIKTWIKQTEIEALNNVGNTIGQTISTINSILIIAVLLPVYLFLLLFYKNLLLEFIRKLFKEDHHQTVFEILFNSKKIIQSYLIGLLVEATIIATLNSLGLIILGIDYAIILGITGALLNVIPYIGGVIAIALPMIIALVTKDSSSSALLVLLVYLFIQFIDNHFIIPRVVAARVKINALISIIAVLVGGALWGIPGMFLSIPLTAIVKVICDYIEPLKPFGFLLGNIVPTAKFQFKQKRKTKSV